MNCHLSALVLVAAMGPGDTSESSQMPKITAEPALSYAYECEDLLQMSAGQKRAFRRALTRHAEGLPTVDQVSETLDALLTVHQRAAWHTALATTGEPGKEPMTLGDHHLMFVPRGSPELRWAAYVGEPIHVRMPAGRPVRRHELTGEALREVWVETGTSFSAVYRAVKPGPARIEVIRDAQTDGPRAEVRETCSFVIVDIHSGRTRIAVTGKTDYWFSESHLTSLADAVSAVKPELRDGQRPVLISVRSDRRARMQAAPDGTEQWLPEELAAATKQLFDALGGIEAGNVGVSVPIAPLRPE
jgi:hypothetical protein